MSNSVPSVRLIDDRFELAVGAFQLRGLAGLELDQALRFQLAHLGDGSGRGAELGPAMHQRQLARLRPRD